MRSTADRKIYHITHVTNLATIVDHGCLWSDAKMIELGISCQVVGMPTIEERRLNRLTVDCHPETRVGDYVPFYFCPRSVMLFILHKGNHPDLAYSGGQDPIVHLVADLETVAGWADGNHERWAFSACNAGASYADFYSNLEQLSRIDWKAVEATDFRDAQNKEGKQAEFLMHDSAPWELIEEIGVRNQKMAERVRAALEDCSHRPDIRVQESWYY